MTDPSNKENNKKAVITAAPDSIDEIVRDMTRVMHMSKSEAKARIEALVREAREEQIMQDFNSLDCCADEKDLIEWRIEAIAALKEGRELPKLRECACQEPVPCRCSGLQAG